MSFPRRGEVWLVNLDPIVGREIMKTRPCVIVQNDLGNQHAPTTIIAPISWTKYVAPVIVEVHPTATNGLSNISYINTSQIRCIETSRMIKMYGTLDLPDKIALDKALKKSLSLS